MTQFTVELDREDDGRWIAEIPALPGALCYGSSKEEASRKAEALEHFKINYIQGPKARNRPAQGNALGKRDRKWQAPTGRNNRCGHSFI
jgi:hypothetical protein